MHHFDIENAAEVNSSLSAVIKVSYCIKCPAKEMKGDTAMILWGLITLITFCRLTGGWRVASPGEAQIFLQLLVCAYLTSAEIC